MNQRLLSISLLLAAVAYLLCIVAQGFPLWSTGQPFPLIPGDFWSIVECIGFVTGIVGVYLMVVQSPWNFPVGLCWAVAYALFFFLEARHLGEGAVMVVTAGYLLHGWWNWTRGIKDSPLQVRRANKSDYLVLAATVLLGWPLVWWAVTALQGKFPAIDSLTTVLSLAAQYFTNRKIFENWYVWIAADLVFIPLMATRGYYPSAILYTVFLAMAFWGIKNWKSNIQNEKSAQPLS